MQVGIALRVLWIFAVLLVLKAPSAMANDSGAPPALTQHATAAATAARTRQHDEQPMRVYLVRSSRPGCEPNCPEWIAAQGKIEVGTLQKFKTVLNHTGKRDLPVYLHSGGGSVSEAMAIGRLLRAKGVDTVVAQTQFMPCAPNDAVCRKNEPDKVLRGAAHFFGTCASSCTFVLAAGKRRFIGSLARIGVHQIKTFQTLRQVRRTYRVVRRPDGHVTRRLLSEETIARKTVVMKTGKDMYDGMEQYFGEMGVGKEIVSLFQSTPNSRVRWLSTKELDSTQLATDRKNGVVLSNEILAEMRGTPRSPDNTGPAANSGK